MVPIVDKATGTFQPAEEVVRSVKPMLDELAKWDRALRTLRR